MKTAFYSLLENETRPHIILGHIHRRQFEIECALVKAGSAAYEGLGDEQALDLVVCSAFAARVSRSMWRANVSVFRASVDRIDARPHRTAHEKLGSILAYRVIGPETEQDEYRAIVRDSEAALFDAWDSLPEAA